MKFLAPAIVIFIIAYATFCGAWQLPTYLIEDRFNAPFNKKPSFTGELGEQRARGYNSMDEDRTLVYSAVYLNKRTDFKSSVVKEALSYWIKGQALAVGGRILNQNNYGSYADYVLQYYLNGFTVNKYARVIYKNGHFYQWSIQETVGISTVKAKKLFLENVPYFKVIK